jgi:cytochrome c oxidase assembly protein subunit 11
MSGHGKSRHPLLLAAVAVGMFGFAFALVPLYEVFCDITGINGRGGNQAALTAEIESAHAIDREVRIGFLAKAARGMPWDFRPTEGSMVVTPGEMYSTVFYVRNRSQRRITGQAVPSVAPGQASLFLKKIECFCFEQQELAPGEELEMGVQFYVEPGMPEHISELTLSYTMFNINDPEAQMVDHHHE